MKESELERKLKLISNHIKRTNLIEYCLSLAHFLGDEVRENVPGGHIDIKEIFEKGELDIICTKKSYSSDERELKVYFRENRVLYAKTYDTGENKFILKVGDFYLYEYKKGSWEKQPKKISKKNSIKPVDYEIPKEIISDLNERYRVEFI